MAHITVPSITISERYLCQGEERFIVRGAVYQIHRNKRGPVGARDPLSNDRVDQVRRDIKHFKELGLNALWIYHVDPKLPHDACMTLLADNGIYIVAVLSDNKQTINRQSPRQSYTAGLRERFQQVVDCLSLFTNVIGVCIANALIVDGSQRLGPTSDICEVISTAIHDLKNYMQSQYVTKGQRVLPVCISDDTWALLNSRSFEYLTRTEVEGRPEQGTIDFYCFTHFQLTEEPATQEWVADEKLRPSFEEMHLCSKFRDLNRPLPILVSEFSSSNNVRPRHFDHVKALYSTSGTTTPEGSTWPPMLDILSGGFVYEYNEGANAYGLMKEEHDGTTTKLPDFDYFKDQMMAASSSHLLQ